MFDDNDDQLKFDDRLKDWVTTTISGLDVSMGTPGQQKTGRGVGLYLLEMLQSPSPSTGTRPPLRLILKYVVTSWASKPEDAHAILVQLMLAAMENPDYEVDLEPVPIVGWSAFRVPPQPSFILRVPLRHERQPGKRTLVRGPLQVNWKSPATLYGIVQGPDAVALSNCRVEIPALNLSTSTDYGGKFFFPNVPEGDKQLIVKAKGRQLIVHSGEGHSDNSAPMRIQFSSWED